MTAGAPRAHTSAAIRRRRPAKKRVDPWRPITVLEETERLPGGGETEALTVFLAGAECPFTCVFCDLWKETLDGPTPPGAIPAQIRAAVSQAGSPLPGAGATIKLYNASNFFDERAVPAADDGAILAAVEGFERVVVECHPRLVGERCLAFAAALARRGARLEVALGLETTHRRAFPRLNKGMTLEDFDRAAERLRAAGCSLRAFVLVGAPYVPGGEIVASAVETVRFALDRGVGTVAMIPVRGGNGSLEELAAEGEFRPPTLAELEAAFAGALDLASGSAAAPVVTVDTWDLEAFVPCSSCGAERLARLARINGSGRDEPMVRCAVACGSGVDRSPSIDGDQE